MNLVLLFIAIWVVIIILVLRFFYASNPEPADRLTVSLSPEEWTQLVCLIEMALRYLPKQNNSPTEFVEDCVQDHGFDIPTETIRKIINQINTYKSSLK